MIDGEVKKVKGGEYNPSQVIFKSLLTQESRLSQEEINPVTTMLLTLTAQPAIHIFLLHENIHTKQ